jgi:Ni,Fe-hydrogenase I cytochrome b subunit
MGEYNWMDSVKKIINIATGYYDTKLPISDPYLIPEMRINNTYPYTFEQTVRVTHYNKPKKRDPARKANRR